MLAPEKYFDDFYEYVDVWSGGYINAYMAEMDNKSKKSARESFISSVLARIEIVNNLRVTMSLPSMNVDDAYDYYINNLPEFNENTMSIELSEYDEGTNKLQNLNAIRNNDINAKVFLIVMGAPDYIIENHHVVQERLDLANRILKEQGFGTMSPKRTEEFLTKILIISNT